MSSAPVRIAFVHHARTRNTGDSWSTPALHFPWPAHRILHLRDPVPPCDAVIYGGGVIHGQLVRDRIHLAAPARIRIAWGIGVSAKDGRRPQDIPLPGGFDLIGVREFGREAQSPAALHVPCASCMLPQFDRPWPVTRAVVGFVNADPNRPAPDLGDLPVLANDRPLEEVIAWLGSAEVVVTNSYHGAYWATLLGRRVVCIPYSSKFHGFRFPPAMATAETWREAIRDAPRHPEALETCRALNRAFYARVRALIGVAD